MKQPIRRHAHSLETPLLPSNPAGLSRATLLFRRLRCDLEEVAHRRLGYADLAQWTGEPKSTLGNWYHGTGQPSSEALLKLLELLPAAKRAEILGQLPFARSFPTLEHPRLCHDPVAVSSLWSALRSEKGLTLIYGERDGLNTFVLSALGHSFALREGRKSRLTGLDVHAADWFVPVPGVTYLNNGARPVEIRAQAEKLWAGASRGKRSLLILNGTWSAVPEIKAKTLELAATGHVIVAEMMRSRTSPPPSLPSPARLVTVSNEGRDGDKIRVEVQLL